MQQPDLKSIRSSAEWFLFHIDTAQRTCTFARLGEAQYRRLSFMDQRMRAELTRAFQYGVGELERVFPSGEPERDDSAWIFHVGHCGSTLLSRALGASPALLPVREPGVLKTLSRTLTELDDPVSLLDRDEWERLRATVCKFLSRTFGQGQRPVVKATSTCNNLIGPILGAGTGRRAVLVHLALEPYLAGQFRTGAPASDVRIQARERMLEWLRIPGAPRLYLRDLGAPCQAALGWLTATWRLREALDALGPRAFWVDFEEFLAGPDRVLSDLCGFIGLEDESARVQDAYREISTRYSKDTTQAFDAGHRKRMLDAARSEHGNPIAEGLDWARRMTERIEALRPCRELLD